MNLKEIFTFNSESNEMVLTKDDELFLEKIAMKIHQHGMVTPAVFFLEMTKPLALLGSHFLVFFGPIINSFIQAENYYRTVQVFEEPKNVEILLEIIERLDKNE